jgi:hypothetical protein
MNQPRNLAASVRQRLLNLAQTQKEAANPIPVMSLRLLRLIG